jgi:hypothetical protein
MRNLFIRAVLIVSSFAAVAGTANKSKADPPSYTNSGLNYYGYLEPPSYAATRPWPTYYYGAYIARPSYAVTRSSPSYYYGSLDSGGYYSAGVKLSAPPPYSAPNPPPHDDVLPRYNQGTSTSGFYWENEAPLIYYHGD